MGHQHVDDLKKARGRLVEDRRAFAKILAGPYERGKTEDARTRFAEFQVMIEAVDRAIEDEQGREPM
jgi:hypothetical protein